MTSIDVRIRYTYAASTTEGSPGRHRYVFTFIAPEGHLEIMPVEFPARSPRNTNSDKLAKKHFETQAAEYGSELEWEYEQ